MNARVPRPIDRPSRVVLAARALAAAVAVMVIAIVAVGIPLALTTLADFGAAGPLFLLIFPALVLSLTLVGGILAVRVPGNPIGWMLEFAGLGMAISIFGGTYVVYAHGVPGGGLPIVVPLAWLSSWLVVPVIGLLGIYVPLLFPTGTFQSPRWRALGLAGIVLSALATVASAFAPGPLSGATWIANPVGLKGGEDLLGVLAAVGNAPAPVLFVAAVASVVVRFRRAATLERQQLKWFGFVAAIAATALVISMPNDGPISDIAWAFGLVAVAALPVAIGIAILRYRLYDIDRIISRTLSYGILTALLAALFAALDLSSQELLAPLVAGNQFAIAASTLVVAVSVQPLRRRVQRVVDRRFHRARYDADRVVAGFTARLRGEIELDALVAGVDETARLAVHPAAASVWLRPSGSGPR